MSKVFISYTQLDRDFVRTIVDALIEVGIPVWWDALEIRPGDHVAKRIEEGIDSSGYFLAVVSEDSANSLWVNTELERAIKRKQDEEDLKIIPLWLSGTHMPMLLEPYSYIDFRSDKDKALRLLRDFLLEDMGLTTRGAQPSQKDLEKQWISKYADGDLQIQLKAIPMLVSLGTTASLHVLLGDLELRDPLVQRRVVRRLPSMLPDDLMPQFTRIAHSVSPALAPWACGYLLTAGRLDILPRLLEFTKSDTPETITAGLRSLSNYRDYGDNELRKVVEVLNGALLDGRNEVRLSALSLAAQLCPQLARNKALISAVLHRAQNLLGVRSPEVRSVAETVYLYMLKWQQEG